MNRMVTFLFLLVWATFVVPPANAQFCAPGDEICRVQQANYRLLDSNRHRGWYQQGRADIETAVRQYINHPSMGWGYYSGGSFVPTPGYNGGGRAARVGRAIEYGAAGASLGYGISGTARGAAIGGGIGLAADIVSSAFAGRSGKVKRIDCSKKRLSREDQSTCAAVEAEQAAAQRAAEIATNGVWHFNNTKLPLVIFDGDPATGGVVVCQMDSRWEASCQSPQSKRGKFVGMMKELDLSSGQYKLVPAGETRLSRDDRRPGIVYLAPTTTSTRRGGV